MRAALLTVIVFLPAVGIVNSVWCGQELKRFLQAVPAIRSWQDLEKFKRAVAFQMYAALIQIVLLLAPWPLFVLGLAMHSLAGADFVYVLLPSLVLGGLGLAYKPVENRAKTMDVAPEFAQEFRRVVNTWMKKPFPDW